MENFENFIGNLDYIFKHQTETAYYRRALIESVGFIWWVGVDCDNN